MDKCKITKTEHEYWGQDNLCRTYTVTQIDVPKSWAIWEEPDEHGNKIPLEA